MSLFLAWGLRLELRRPMSLRDKAGAERASPYWLPAWPPKRSSAIAPSGPSRPAQLRGSERQKKKKQQARRKLHAHGTDGPFVEKSKSRRNIRGPRPATKKRVRGRMSQTTRSSPGGAAAKNPRKQTFVHALWGHPFA